MIGVRGFARAVFPLGLGLVALYGQACFYDWEDATKGTDDASTTGGQSDSADASPESSQELAPALDAAIQPEAPTDPSSSVPTATQDAAPAAPGTGGGLGEEAVDTPGDVEATPPTTDGSSEPPAEPVEPQSCEQQGSCQSLGGMCTTDAECEPELLCRSGLCKSSLGAPCETDQACADSSCPPSGVCTKLQAPGRSCDSDRDCEYLCLRNLCVGAFGSSCASADWCESGLCYENRCSRGRLGDPCPNSAACEAGLVCARGACRRVCKESSDCDSTDSCSNSACLGGETARCESDNECVEYCLPNGFCR